MRASDLPKAHARAESLKHAQTILDMCDIQNVQHIMIQVARSNGTTEVVEFEVHGLDAGEFHAHLASLVVLRVVDLKKKLKELGVEL